MLLHPFLPILLERLGIIVTIPFQGKILHGLLISLLTQKRSAYADVRQIKIAVHGKHLSPGLPGLIILSLLELIDGVEYPVPEESGHEHRHAAVQRVQHHQITAHVVQSHRPAEVPVYIADAAEGVEKPSLIVICKQPSPHLVQNHVDIVFHCRHVRE